MGVGGEKAKCYFTRTRLPREEMMQKLGQKDKKIKAGNVALCFELKSVSFWGGGVQKS